MNSRCYPPNSQFLWRIIFVVIFSCESNLISLYDADQCCILGDTSEDGRAWRSLTLGLCRFVSHWSDAIPSGGGYAGSSLPSHRRLLCFSVSEGDDSD